VIASFARALRAPGAATRTVARRLRRGPTATASGPTSDAAATDPPGPTPAQAVEALRAHVEERLRIPAGDLVALGTCNICGATTVFVWREGAPRRESLTCAECLSTSRYRSLARGLLRAIAEVTGIRAPSLGDLPREGPPFAVYDTQLAFAYPPTLAYPIPDLLAATGWIEVHSSRYRPSDPWGTEYALRMTNQDLEALTFGDDSFDVVLTSDVMEHVRLDDRAHREIARVLRPGGFYLFTVPHTRAVRETLVRVQVGDPGDPSTDVHLLEPEYHGSADDGEGGVLSYRAYGTDLDDTLASLGFDVEYWFGSDPDHAIADTELFTCRLRAEP
jgi:O-antigen biosynthesis protein